MLVDSIGYTWQKKLTYNSKKTTFTLSAIFVEVFISGTEMIREKTRVTLQGQIPLSR
jgi:hypothetical protein